MVDHCSFTHNLSSCGLLIKGPRSVDWVSIGILIEYWSRCPSWVSIEGNDQHLITDTLVLMICFFWCNLQFYTGNHKFYKDYKLHMPCRLVQFIVVSEKSKLPLKLFPYQYRSQLCQLYVTIKHSVADLFILFYSICPCYIMSVLTLNMFIRKINKLTQQTAVLFKRVKLFELLTQLKINRHGLDVSS